MGSSLYLFANQYLCMYVWELLTTIVRDLMHTIQYLVTQYLRKTPNIFSGSSISGATAASDLIVWAAWATSEHSSPGNQVSRPFGLPGLRKTGILGLPLKTGNPRNRGNQVSGPSGLHELPGLGKSGPLG